MKRKAGISLLAVSRSPPRLPLHWPLCFSGRFLCCKVPARPGRSAPHRAGGSCLFPHPTAGESQNRVLPRQRPGLGRCCSEHSGHGAPGTWPGAAPDGGGAPAAPAPLPAPSPSTLGPFRSALPQRRPLPRQPSVCASRRRPAALRVPPRWSPAIGGAEGRALPTSSRRSGRFTGLSPLRTRRWGASSVPAAPARGSRFHTRPAPCAGGPGAARPGPQGPRSPRRSRRCPRAARPSPPIAAAHWPAAS